MSPTVYLYVILFTALLASAAAAVEWGAQGRIPTRHVWSVAIFMAMVVPPAAMGWRAMHPAATRSQAIASIAVPGAARVTWRAQALTSAIPAAAPGWMISERVTSVVTATLSILWVTSSLALAAWLMFGLLHWRRARRAWRPATLDGVRVEVSDATGPAVLGVLSQRIVMPSWATEMESEKRKLMLAHECEHINARDPQRLALAVLALVLMPWNAVLWWSAARLRRAVEMDCDARVLRRFPRPREYGYLLLEVAARGRNVGPLAVPLVALLSLPSELELRIKAMTRPRSMAARTVLVGGAVAVVAVCSAFAAPIPALKIEPAGTTANRVTTPSTARTMLVIAQPGTRHGMSRQLQPELFNALDSAESTKVVYFGSSKVVLRSARGSIPGDGKTYRVRIGIHDGSHSPEDFAAIIAAEDSTRHNVIDPAVRQYFPDVAATARSNTVLWFVADTAGRVLKFERDDELSSLSMSPATLHEKFPQFASDEFRWGSIEKETVGRTSFTVVWFAVKAR